MTCVDTYLKHEKPAVIRLRGNATEICLVPGKEITHSDARLVRYFPHIGK